MADRESEPSRVAITRSEKGCAFVLPIKPQSFRRLLYVVWLGIWLICEGVLIGGLSGWISVGARSPATLRALLVLFSPAGAFIVWRLLWYCGGREVFTVTHDELVVRRDLLGIGRSILIPLRLLRRLRVGKLNYRAIYPSWGRLFMGHGDSELLVPTEDGQVAYGKGLEESEATALADLINEEVRNRVAANQVTQTRAGGL